MRSRVLAIAFAFAFGADAQACFADTAAPTAPIEKLFAAFNADGGARLAEAYAPNAVIVDEFAPFVWRGPAAGTSFGGLGVAGSNPVYPTISYSRTAKSGAST